MQDGYMVGFLGTSTLANFIRNPNDNLPCKKSKISALMDGHFFVIKNIKYDEQNDNVKIGIMTWGEETEATIPFKVWEAHKGMVGKAIIGQTPYADAMFRAKARGVNFIDTYCSPESYCQYLSGVIYESSNYKDIQTMLDRAFKHVDGQTWMESAKKIQDFIERLPKEKRPNIPGQISIISPVTPELITEFNRIHDLTNRKEKIEALEKMKVKDNIEVQKQMVVFYAQEGQWGKIKELFASVPTYSETDRTIMKESLEQGCGLAGNNKIPSDIISLIRANTLLNAEHLINYLSAITGLSKGGSFTYGVKGRLLEVVNIRRHEDGKDKIENLQANKLDEKDVKNLVSLLDREVHKNEPLHKKMDALHLNTFCDYIIEQLDHTNRDQKNNKATPSLVGIYKDSFLKKIKEFFLKVASILSENVITKRTHFKDEVTKMKESPCTDSDNDVRPSSPDSN
jgi:hypothetical protein